MDPEVVVVDNHSFDGSAAMVEQDFRQVRLIVNGRNAGFAAANNQAIRASSGEYVLLLNSDTIMLPDTLQRLLSFMETHPDAGICGAHLLGADGEEQRSFWRSMPTIFSQIRHELPFGRYAQRAGDTAVPGNEAFAVARVPGACMMIRRTAIDRIGFLDERFFFYTEDLDWCHRARAAGWQIYVVPRAHVVHFGGGSSSRDQEKFDVEFYKSRYRYLKKHYGFLHLALFRGVMVPLMFLRCVKAAMACIVRLQDLLKRKEHWQYARNCLLLARFMLTER